VAVDGRGAFRRFKDVLMERPDDRADWYAFSAERRRGRARAWLTDAGYRPSPASTSRLIAWGLRARDDGQSQLSPLGT
jgi:hypothetical protein